MLLYKILYHFYYSYYYHTFLISKLAAAAILPFTLVITIPGLTSLVEFRRNDLLATIIVEKLQGQQGSCRQPPDLAVDVNGHNGMPKL